MYCPKCSLNLILPIVSFVALWLGNALSIDNQTGLKAKGCPEGYKNLPVKLLKNSKDSNAWDGALYAIIDYKSLEVLHKGTFAGSGLVQSISHCLPESSQYMVALVSSTNGIMDDNIGVEVCNTVAWHGNSFLVVDISTTDSECKLVEDASSKELPLREAAAFSILTSSPTRAPSVAPTAPTLLPTVAPSTPTLVPTIAPSSPTVKPSVAPTAPTVKPTVVPTTPTPGPSIVLTKSIAPSTSSASGSSSSSGSGNFTGSQGGDIAVIVIVIIIGVAVLAFSFYRYRSSQLVDRPSTYKGSGSMSMNRSSTKKMEGFGSPSPDSGRGGGFFSSSRSASKDSNSSNTGKKSNFVGRASDFSVEKAGYKSDTNSPFFAEFRDRDDL